MSRSGVAVRRYTIEYAGAPVVRGRYTAHPQYRGEVRAASELQALFRARLLLPGVDHRVVGRML